MWNVSTQTILFHIKKRNVIIIVPLLLSAYISQSHASVPARKPLTCSCARSGVRWRAWGRRKRQRSQSWKASALAACTSGKEMREQWCKRDKRTSAAHWAGLIGSWVRVWSACSSHLSHGTTGRALQMGNNCVRVWVHLWVFAGTSVRKKQSEKGRRTKKRTSAHWFEQNTFLHCPALGLCVCKKWQNESPNPLTFFSGKIVMSDHRFSYFSQITWL